MRFDRFARPGAADHVAFTIFGRWVSCDIQPLMVGSIDRYSTARRNSPSCNGGTSTSSVPKSVVCTCPVGRLARVMRREVVMAPRYVGRAMVLQRVAILVALVFGAAPHGLLMRRLMGRRVRLRWAEAVLSGIVGSELGIMVLAIVRGGYAVSTARSTARIGGQHRDRDVDPGLLHTSAPTIRGRARGSQGEPPWEFKVHRTLQPAPGSVTTRSNSSSPRQWRHWPTPAAATS